MLKSQGAQEALHTISEAQVTCIIEVQAVRAKSFPNRGDVWIHSAHKIQIQNGNGIVGSHLTNHVNVIEKRANVLRLSAVSAARIIFVTTMRGRYRNQCGIGICLDQIAKQLVTCAVKAI